MREFSIIGTIAVNAFILIRYCTLIYRGKIKPALAMWLFFSIAVGGTLITYLSEGDYGLLDNILCTSDLILVSTITIFIILFGDKSSKLNVKEDRITIEEVQEGVFQDYISITGTVLPIKTIYLDAIEGGIVEEILAEEGTMVKQGDVILHLANTNLRLNIMNREASLAAIPVKNDVVEETSLSNGDSLLRYPAIPRKRVLMSLIGRIRRASPKVRSKKLQLDTLGSEVWRLIDNRRTVQEIIERFARHHQLSLRESEVAVTQFLRSLGKRGLIGLK